jgi:hypothetical protein
MLVRAARYRQGYRAAKGRERVVDPDSIMPTIAPIVDPPLPADDIEYVDVAVEPRDLDSDPDYDF